MSNNSQAPLLGLAFLSSTPTPIGLARNCLPEDGGVPDTIGTGHTE